MAEDPELAAARERMIARRFGGKTTATGGKGTVRRKHKAVHKTATSDDKKLGTNLAMFANALLYFRVYFTLHSYFSIQAQH